MSLSGPQITALRTAQELGDAPVTAEPIGLPGGGTVKIHPATVRAAARSGLVEIFDGPDGKKRFRATAEGNAFDR